MKVYSVLVLIALIYGTESYLSGFDNKTCSDFYRKTNREHQAYSYDMCRSVNYDGYHKCCYMKYESGDNVYYNCAPLSIDDYYDINAAISKIESTKAITIKKLYCNSSYLYASFLLILIFLL